MSTRARIESRLKKIETRLTPPRVLIVLTCYDGCEGVGWSAPGCETEAEALKRVGPRGPHDLVCLIQACGCDQAGTPHRHTNDVIQRWPMPQ
jgi:hypothetical protein